MNAVLLLCPACPDSTALAARMAPRGARVVRLPANPIGHRVLLQALRDHQAQPGASWLATPDPTWIQAAVTAGLAGVALLGRDPPPGDPGLTVSRADDLLDVPRVLVPRQGGCWHDHLPGDSR